MALLQLQFERGMGVFACDGQMVFSNVRTALSQAATTLQGSDKSQPVIVETVKVPVSDAHLLAHAAWLNAADYLECWKKLGADGRFLWYDFVVKVDPDTAFVPGRLRNHLRSAPLTGNRAVYFTTCSTTARKCVHTVTVGRTYGEDWTFKVVGTSTDQFSISADCDATSKHTETCQKHHWGNGVNVVQDQNGRPVKEGNCCNERETVKSMESECPQRQADSLEPGLSGALEVISKDAVALYVKQGQRCSANRYSDVGEEFFMQECLELLGARPLAGAHLLSDEFCGGVPGNCTTAEAAFHPLRTPQAFIRCLGDAFSNYQVPEMDRDLLVTGGDSSERAADG